jgi:hypothetical protein
VAAAANAVAVVLTVVVVSSDLRDAPQSRLASGLMIGDSGPDGTELIALRAAWIVAVGSCLVAAGGATAGTSTYEIATGAAGEVLGTAAAFGRSVVKDGRASDISSLRSTLISVSTFGAAGVD